MGVLADDPKIVYPVVFLKLLGLEALLKLVSGVTYVEMRTFQGSLDVVATVMSINVLGAIAFSTSFSANVFICESFGWVMKLARRAKVSSRSVAPAPDTAGFSEIPPGILKA